MLSDNDGKQSSTLYRLLQDKLQWHMASCLAFLEFSFFSPFKWLMIMTKINNTWHVFKVIKVENK